MVPQPIRKTGAAYFPFQNRFSFFLLLLLAVFFAAPTLKMLSGIYLRNPDYSHGLLVPLVSIYALYGRRTGLSALTLSPSWIGPAVMLPGVLLMLTGQWYHLAMMQEGLGTAFMEGVGFIMMAAGICLSVCGTRATAAMTFPIGFLFCAVPLPYAFTDTVTLPLRQMVTVVSEIGIRWLSIPVLREGNILHTAAISLGVEDACSGIRSLWAMVMLAIVTAYLFRLGFKKGLFLSLLSVPSALAANIFRVVFTAWLTNRISPGFASGWQHAAVGILTFGIGLILLVLAGWGLSKWKQKAPSSRRAQPSAPKMPGVRSSARKKPGVRAVLCGMLCLGIIASYSTARHYSINFSPSPPRNEFRHFPGQFGPFMETGHYELTEAEFTELKPTDRLRRTYVTPGGHRFGLLFLYWDPVTVRGPMAWLYPHRPDGCYPAAGWQLVRKINGESLLKGSGDTIEAWFFKKRREGLRLLVFWEKEPSFPRSRVPGPFFSRLRALIETWNDPLKSYGPRWSVTLDVEVQATPEAAVDTAAEIITALTPILPEYGINSPKSH